MKVIAIVNQKGGVGKTTTAVNLSCGLAKRGYRVLAIDLDQQGHLTKSMGLSVNGNTALEWLVNDLPLDIVVHKANGVDVVMADITLANLELDLQRKLLDREYVLGKALTKATDYDYVIIDSPPSFSIITINILTAADRVIVPFRPDYLSKDGVHKLLETTEQIQQRLNPKLKLAGFLPTLVDKRCNNQTSFAEAQALAERYGGRVFGEGIRLASVLCKAPEQGLSIFDFKPTSDAAKDYQTFIDEFLKGESK
ncbi:MAG: AAA family ATPase [Prevotella sp.]|nr:AAA family ATPase [Prevotella sp.]